MVGQLSRTRWSERLEQVREALDEALGQGVFTAASLWVGSGREPLGCVHVGGGAASTWYDLASLTKPIATASIAMKAVDDGAVELDERVNGGPTVQALLGHRGGFPAHRRFEADWDRERCERAVWACRDDALPCTYSDLGYMVLGWFLEERLGAGLEHLLAEVSPMRFGPQLRAEFQTPITLIDTGMSPLRGIVPPGEVHDDNCWVLGGVAGHAGLFGRAQDVGIWGQDLLVASQGASDRTIQPDTVRAFWTTERFQDDDSWVLGFDTPTPPRSSAGRWISPGSVGHLGFTGTSVWIDRAKNLVAVLLTNRVVHRGTHAAIKRLRPKVHDLLLKPAS